MLLEGFEPTTIAFLNDCALNIDVLNVYKHDALNHCATEAHSCHVFY